MRAVDNPYRVSRLHQLRYRYPGFSKDAFLARLHESRYRGAIVGPEGTGKTTLLLELGRWLASDGYQPIYVRHINQLPKSQRQMVILFDGVERLSRWEGWRLRRISSTAAGLVVTSHVEGFLPTLHVTSSSPEVLAELLSELDTVPPECSAKQLLEYHGGNVRNVFRELYDQVSDQPSMN